MRFHLKSAVFWGVCAIACQNAKAAPIASIGSNTYVAKPSKLWTEPNRFGEPIAELKAGLPLEILDYDATRSWMMVRTPSGREGWIPLRYTSQDTRRSQPMIGSNHSSDDEGGDRSPAGSFEEAVQKDENAGKAAGKKSGGGWPMEFSLGYSHMSDPESANGFSLGASAIFHISPSLSWGPGLSWKMHMTSATGSCFSGTDTCTVSRNSQHIFPNVALRYHTGALQAGLALGLAIDHTGLTTTRASDGSQVLVDPNTGLMATGSGNEMRIGAAVNVNYGFEVGADLSLGPYLEYNLDIAMSDGSGVFVGSPSGSIFNFFGGGVFLQKAF